MAVRLKVSAIQGNFRNRHSEVGHFRIFSETHDQWIHFFSNGRPRVTEGNILWMSPMIRLWPAGVKSYEFQEEDGTPYVVDRNMRVRLEYNPHTKEVRMILPHYNHQAVAQE